MVGSVSSRLNDRNIGALCHSLNKLKVQWKDLPVAAQNGLIDNIMKHAKNLEPRHGTFTSVCVHWACFCCSTYPTTHIATLIVFNILWYRFQLIGTMLIYSLGLMGLDIEKISQKFRDSLYLVTMSVLNEAINTDSIQTGKW